MEPSAVRQILAIKLKSIGDVLLMTPALEVLHRLFPQAGISVMVLRGSEGILQNHPFVTRVIVVGDVGQRRPSWRRLPREWKLLRELRAARYDLVVNFSSSDYGPLLGYLSGARHRVGYVRKKKAWSKRSLYTHAFAARVSHTVLKDVELVREYAASFGREAFAGIDLEAGGLVLRPLETDLVWAREQWRELARADEPRVILHPVSRLFWKCWETAKMAALVDRLRAESGAGVVLTSGPGTKEMEMAKEILSLCKNPIPSRLGCLTLAQLAALVREADLFVGVDSAPMHIAAAVGTRVVAIFGPTDDAHWSPWGKEHRVVRRPCPCIESGRRRCDESQVVACLRELTVAEVFQAVQDSRLISVDC